MVRCSTWTYDNAAGTLTFGAQSTAANTVNGVTLTSGQRILVKDQTTAAQNGVYSLTTAGADGSAAAVLTRAADMDAAAEFADADYDIDTRTADCLDQEDAMVGGLHIRPQQPKGNTYGRKRSGRRSSREQRRGA